MSTKQRTFDIYAVKHLCPVCQPKSMRALLRALMSKWLLSQDQVGRFTGMGSAWVGHFLGSPSPCARLKTLEWLQTFLEYPDEYFERRRGYGDEEIESVRKDLRQMLETHWSYSEAARLTDSSTYNLRRFVNGKTKHPRPMSVMLIKRPQAREHPIVAE